MLSPRMEEKFIRAGLWTCTSVALLILFFIVGFILCRGLPGLRLSFLTQEVASMGKEGGIFPFIVATLYVTGLAILVAMPLGVGTAIYLTEYTRAGKFTNFIRFGADCLAGVPSIIFGLFGFVFFVIALKLGFSILAGGLTLALMVLPTIIRTSEEAIRAVPRSYREVAFALGGTRWQMVTKVVLPSALPGILTGVILSVGRSVSETAAVMLTAGSALRLSISPFSPGRTLAYHFYILAREGISMPNAYKTAAVLIIAIILVNFSAYSVMRRFLKKVS